jgi:predicted metal-dependent enzyme (double-stranded beta helix superfamily)
MSTVATQRWDANAIERMAQQSFDAMEGWVAAMDSSWSIGSFEALVQALDELYSVECAWPERYAALRNLLGRVKLSSREISKFISWGSSELPYTRNLVATDGRNYSLLVLCWNAGRESKIHNHPCQGCFVMPMSGTLVETIYSVHPETEEIREEFATTYKPWQISFMSDELGLHKISNGSPDTGAVSLHLYTPPFNSCKVGHCWALGHRARLAARAQP